MKNRFKIFNLLTFMLIFVLSMVTNVFSWTKNSVQKLNQDLDVHYIDVGQADSILIQQNGHNMLIDAGNNDDSNLIINYLKNQGVLKLDYVIGTYPHEDHIGGLDAVINSFDIGKIYMPKVTSTTETFKDVITSIKNKGKQIVVPKVGDSFKLGDAVCTILAPNGKKYEDLNNYSIVTKIKFGNNSFIFTGDAEDISEKEILRKQLDIKADVFKIGHYGSSSSTINEFLNKVNPKYAIISCGKDNKYGYPTYEVIHKLNEKNIKIFRTDEQGTIKATSDGKNIIWNVKPLGNKTMNGFGSNTLKNGDYYIGYWKRDVFCGKGTLKYKNGDVYTGNFTEGKRQGHGKYSWKNGEKYEGEWSNDKMSGNGTYTFKNGDKYKGEWLNDKMNGNGTYTFENGKVLKGQWLDNEIIGY